MKNNAVLVVVAAAVFFSYTVFLLLSFLARSDNASLTSKEQELKKWEAKLESTTKMLDLKARLLDESARKLDNKAKQSELLEGPQTAAKKPRIAIVSLYYGEPTAKDMDIVSMSLTNKLAYAHKHGYTYLYYHNHLVDDKKAPHWSKILVLQHYLEMREWDWLFWIDMDTLILNADSKLEEFVEGLDPNTNLILSKDENGLNNGVFLVRSCEWSIWYMQQVMSKYFLTRNHPLKEQQAQTEVHKAIPETQEHIKWVPQRAMNSYVEGPKDGMYKEGDFLIHFAGYSARAKVALMKQYMAATYTYPSDLQMWTVKAVENTG